MGLKKNQTLLSSGAITKAEYDRRMTQRAMSMQAKGAKKVAKRRTQAAIKQAQRPPNQRNQISVSRVSRVETRLGAAYNANETKEILAYVCSLVAPEDYAARVPDAFPQPSALYRSTREFEIPLNDGVVSPPDAGRFAVCLMPRLGPSTSATINAYNLYVVRPDLDWSTADWTSASTYLPASEDGVVLYQDPQYSHLITNAMGNEVSFFAQQGSAMPVFTSTTELWIGDMLDSMTSQKESFEWTHADGIIIPPSQSIRDFYFVITWFTGAGQSAWTSANASSAGSPTLTVTAATSNNAVLNSTTTGSRTYAGYVLNIPRSGGNFNIKFTFAGTVPTTFSGMTFESGLVDRQTTTKGIVSQLRPVSASLLATWRGEILHNAGTISAALGTNSGLDRNWLTNDASAGWQAQEWQTYAQVPNTDGNIYHGGPIDKGAYVWWVPGREADTFYQPYTQSLLEPYPPLFISGRYVTTAESTPTIVLRGRAELCFEYLTPNPLINTKQITRHANAMTRSLAVLDHIGLPRAMENPLHVLLAGLAKLGIGAFLSKLGVGAAQAAGGAVSNLLSRSSLSYNSRSGVTASIGASKMP